MICSIGIKEYCDPNLVSVTQAQFFLYFNIILNTEQYQSSLYILITYDLPI